jgi:hypothetical protein
MAKKAEPSRVAAALQYLQQMRDRAADFGGGVVDTLADRARDVGGLAYEAFTSDPNIGRMTTAEYAQAANRPTPRLDQAAQDLGTIGKAIVTQPIQTGKALVQGEVERARQAMTSPRAAGEYAGSMVDPLRLASALRRGPMLELDVYHGSPHRFEEFDASKIGTGEGAQAYGHGIYLAESPKVAANYRSQLAPGTIRTIDGGDYDPANPEHIAAKYLNTFSQRNYSLQKIADLLEEDASLLQQEGHKKAAEIVRSGKVEKLGKVGHRPSGALYTADLPDEMVDRMLDWDKPFLEQSDEIKKFAKNSLPAAVYNQLLTQRSGDMVEELAKYKGGKAKASELMRQAGIPGIRYLDAGSRGQGGSGTRNFVVFPGEEKKVKILKRE